MSVGHCHPQVVEAANRQNEFLQHATTIYLHPNIAEYARELAAKMPGDLKVCYFVNSGSEANDLALLMARAYTGNYDVIAFEMPIMAERSPWDLRRTAPGSLMFHTASECTMRSPRIHIGDLGTRRSPRRTKIRGRRQN